LESQKCNEMRSEVVSSSIRQRQPLHQRRQPQYAMQRAATTTSCKRWLGWTVMTQMSESRTREYGLKRKAVLGSAVRASAFHAQSTSRVSFVASTRYRESLFRSDIDLTETRPDLHTSVTTFFSSCRQLQQPHTNTLFPGGIVYLKRRKAG
jgi:hypothetical protein